LTKFLGAGGVPAFASAILLALGGSGPALAQQVSNYPVVQAVVRTAINPVTSATAPAPTVRPAPVPLSALVESNKVGAELDEQGKCLATAVYFESMGEPVEGQLAVANVVINRARSGQYPASWCGVVKQKAQFSFVHAGHFPRIDTGCEAWLKAQSVARIAALNLTSMLPSDVLWYHADYVAPRWRNNLQRVEKIGAHIFYRA
jgi:hypothetical protein